MRSHSSKICPVKTWTLLVRFNDCVGYLQTYRNIVFAPFYLNYHLVNYGQVRDCVLSLENPFALSKYCPGAFPSEYGVAT